ncbi:MAG: DHHA1 domain-containing protein [Gemmatimonadales bacterium]
MSTHRLYFDDPYLVRFAAHVVATRGHQVALDRSAFYPEGGGQPADHGMLGGVPVTDVQVDDDNVVWHTLSGPLDTDEVIGTIDWPRRHDHMQQHHGQHLLSAAFEELFQLPTVSFHLGAESSTIDLLAATVGAGEVEAVEARVNQVIWEDRPVTAMFVSREELGQIPLRKPPTVEGPIRIVSVPGFDHSACGGTHPSATGAVGLLHIRRLEKRGGEMRVEFVCGARTLRDLRQKHDLLDRLARASSIGTDELEQKVMKLQAEHSALRKELAETKRTLWGWLAQDMIDNEGDVIGGVAVLTQVFTDRSDDDVRGLAMELAMRGGIGLFASIWEGKARLIFTAPSLSPIEAGMLLRETLAEFGGKGGGHEHLAQGTLDDPEKARAAVQWAAGRVGREKGEARSEK